MAQEMQAIVIDSFVERYEDLHVTTIPAPKPTHDQLLIRITHAGLNYVDLLYCRGKHQNNQRHMKPPFTLGLEFAGIVQSAPQSSGLKKGDRVYGGSSSGAYAEQIAVPASAVRKLPQGWTLAAAAAMAATAPVSYGALVRVAKVQKGETVLIHAAAGGLGVMACQVAKALGAEVIGAVGSAAKAKILKERLGVDKAVNYSEEGWEKKVLELTRDSKGVDVVYDPVGLVEKSIRCTKYMGRIIVAGFAGREGGLEKIAANRILLKSIQVIGYRYGETGRQFPEETSAIWQGLTQMLEKGLIKPIVYDDEDFDGLGSLPKAMQAMAERKIWGKAVITVQSEATASKI